MLVPVVTDQHGTVLDGHHRKTIADRLKVKYRVDVITVAGDSEAREIAPHPQKNGASSAKTSAAKSPPSCASKATHCAPSAARSASATGQSAEDLAAEELRTGTQLAPERVKGLDGGKSRPARRPVIIAAKHEREAARIREPLADVLPETRRCRAG